MLVQEIINFLGCNTEFLNGCAVVFSLVSLGCIWGVHTFGSSIENDSDSGVHYSHNPRFRAIQKSAEFWFGDDD